MYSTGCLSAAVYYVLLTTCSVIHLLYMYTTRTLHVHFTYTTCTLHFTYTYTACTLHLHYMYTTRTVMISTSRCKLAHILVDRLLLCYITRWRSQVFHRWIKPWWIRAVRPDTTTPWSISYMCVMYLLLCLVRTGYHWILLRKCLLSPTKTQYMSDTVQRNLI